MDTNAISVNLNRELAAKAKPVLSHYGIDIETALNDYLMRKSILRECQRHRLEPVPYLAFSVFFRELTFY